jgi:hypothetical protein
MIINLDDLIHNSLSAELLQSKVTFDVVAKSATEAKFHGILAKLQKNDEEFDKFFVMDLLKRAKLTLEALRDNS